MSIDKCPFCDMGQARRIMIFRLTKDLSRLEIRRLISGRGEREYICYKCGKKCKNAGNLTMHMRNPGVGYRRIHNKYDKEQGVENVA